MGLAEKMSLDWALSPVLISHIPRAALPLEQGAGEDFAETASMVRSVGRRQVVNWEGKLN